MAEPLPKLRPGSTVVTAWAEPAAGPGWANPLVWVLVRHNDEQGLSYETVALQPEHQTEAILTLYHVSDAANRAMTAAVRDVLKPPKRGRRGE